MLKTVSRRVWAGKRNHALTERDVGTGGLQKRERGERQRECVEPRTVRGCDFRSGKQADAGESLAPGEMLKLVQLAARTEAWGLSGVTLEREGSGQSRRETGRS